MNCELVADIPVERFAVLAEMAWMESRPELGLLCQAARETGRRISVESVERALPGVSEAGAANILSWCQLLGLCDARGSLTLLGEEVADTGEAPVPEQGLYELWTVEHPLLGQRILHAERLQASRDARPEEVVPLPLPLKPGRTFESVVEPGTRFMLRALPSGRGAAGCIRRPGLTCRLRWRLDFTAGTNQWHLEGTLLMDKDKDKVSKPLQHRPETEQLDLWRIFEEWARQHLSQSGRWDAMARRLALPFSQVAKQESAQESFVLTQELPSVSIPGKGEYSRVVVRDIPIGPAAQEDASRWARAQLDRKLSAKRAYLTRSGVRALFLSLVEDTPLAPLQPTLASHDTLAQETRTRPEVFWNLTAPVDLAPFPLPAEERSAFTAGPAAVAPAPARGDRVVKLPYRGSWSMQQLLTALLEGGTPRRVLLCDRYVQGDGNLDTLALMVQTLRELQPAVHVDVVTAQDAASPQASERIRKLVGRHPLRFQDLFGARRGDHPHDRYLLVETDSGGGFGWQMSNSPLDARPGSGAPPTPKTPLRWRDFAAHKRERTDLPMALSRWFEGGAP
jgi:hypothetical protein